MCPFNIFFQGVACSVVQLELQALGLATTFEPIEVQTPQGGDEAWAGVRRTYFHSGTYYLPHAVLGASERGDAANNAASGAASDAAPSASSEGEGASAQLVSLNGGVMKLLVRSIVAER